ncbi:MAG: class I SAM-dependent methyltransferase [Chloroflexi bacterium]|nr:class I SAM-dependent methyltransferase [Chloroflexota bacterium]
MARLGAGGGRFALRIARRVRRLVAIEPSAAMRDVLTQAISAVGATNIDVHDLRWPSATWTEGAEVALAAHCLYDIREVGPSIEAIERHAHRLCVVALAQFARGTQLATLFEVTHGEPLQALPALKEFVALLGAYHRPYQLQLVRGDAADAVRTHDEAYALAGRLLRLQPGSAKDARMRALVDEW